MTLLCWLNLVMMDTSMKGFGSVETESRVKDTRRGRSDQEFDQSYEEDSTCVQSDGLWRKNWIEDDGEDGTWKLIVHLDTE